nr:hypothetical protein [Tanacetum cinerariifolium]
IEQYFQIQDYALWDVIENGNSFVPVMQTTTAEGGAVTTTISSPITTEENIKKKNDVKANQSNGSQLVHEDLEQIHEDDLEEMDLNYMAEDEVPTNMALMDFSDSKPQFESYGPKSCEIESKNASEDITNELKGYPDAPLVKDRVLDNKDYSVESLIVVEKKTVVPTIAKVKVVRPKQ